MSFDVTIKREIPSGNSFHKQNWRVYAREKKAWHILLRAWLRPIVAEPVKVSAVILCGRKRVLDYGNLVAGCKFIPDILQDLGYLYDDSPAWFQCTYSQRLVVKGEACFTHIYSLGVQQ